MKILEKIPVPTGFIVVVEGAKGMLEFLSIGDYGKPVNLNPDAPVPDNPPLLALTDKWVTTISTQYGCSMGCQFCDVPAVGKGTNATLNDLQQQILLSLKLFPEVAYSNRFNVHYARMGEPMISSRSGSGKKMPDTFQVARRRYERVGLLDVRVTEPNGFVQMCHFPVPEHRERFLKEAK